MSSNKTSGGFPNSIWLDNVDPSDSETDVGVNDWYQNTSTKHIFICRVSTIGAQVWEKILFPGDVPSSPVRTFSQPSFSDVTSAQQLSDTRDAFVSYSFPESLSISLLAGQSITITLKYADDSGISSNVVTLASKTVGNSGVLGLASQNDLCFSFIIPAGKYRKITLSSTGSPTLPNSLSGAQEVLL